MQTVTIPQGFKPFKVTINYQDYEFEPGKEYQVADDVYEQIKHHIAGLELPEGNRIYIEADSPAFWYPATDTEPERIEAMGS